MVSEDCAYVLDASHSGAGGAQRVFALKAVLNDIMMSVVLTTLQKRWRTVPSTWL